MPRKKNRRRERRHVLDVKLSSNQVRRRRVQLAASALFSVVLLTVTVYGLWRGGWWGVQRFVFQNEQLKIREFVVQTDGVIDKRLLERWTGVKIGDNLFAIDLHAIKRELEMHGMIRKAALERVLPGTLRLQVTERVPLARVRLRFNSAEGRIRTREFGLDRSGRVMPLDGAIVRPETVLGWQRLVEITGISEREIVPGRDLTNQLARAALEFIASFSSSSMSRLVQLAAIDVSEPEVLHLKTLQGRTVEVLDRGFDQQLARWEVIHRMCQSNQVAYTWLDLSPTNNLPLRIAPLASVAPLNHPPDH